MPRLIDQILFNLSTSLSIFTLLGIFVSPLLALLAPGYFISIWWIVRRCKNHLLEVKELDSALKTRLSFLIEDITKGINQTRASGLREYFEIRLEIFREKIVQTELFLTGMKFRISSICYWVNYFLVTVPILVFAGLTQDSPPFNFL